MKASPSCMGQVIIIASCAVPCAILLSAVDGKRVLCIFFFVPSDLSFMACYFKGLIPFEKQQSWKCNFVIS